MDRLLEASRERAWSQLNIAVIELEHALEVHERTRYPGRGRSDDFTLSLRRDNLAAALRQLSDIRRRVHARHFELLQDDVADVMYLCRRAPIHSDYFKHEFAQAFSILEVADADLIYEAPSLVVSPAVIAPVSDALLAELAKNPRLLFEVSPRQFEEVIAELFSREGFDVELTQATRDGGIDIIAISRRLNIWQKLVVECKRYKPENRVGISVVQRVLGAKMQMNANKAVVVTTSSFSRDAQAVAREKFWDLDLKAYNDVVGWLHAASGR